MGLGEGLPHTIDHQMEILVTFCSVTVADSSPVQPAVLKGQVINPQGRCVGHMDPLLKLVLEVEPFWNIPPRKDIQHDYVV